MYFYIILCTFIISTTAVLVIVYLIVRYYTSFYAFTCTFIMKCIQNSYAKVRLITYMYVHVYTFALLILKICYFMHIKKSFMKLFAVLRKGFKYFSDLRFSDVLIPLFVYKTWSLSPFYWEKGMPKKIKREALRYLMWFDALIRNPFH